MLKKKLVFTFLVAVVTSGVVIKTSSMIYDSSTRKSYNKAIIEDSVLFNMENDYKITAGLSDNNETKISNFENSSNINLQEDYKNNTTNKKKNDLLESDKSNNNISSTTNAISKKENANNGVNTEKSTNVISKSNDKVNINSKVETTNTNEKEEKKIVLVLI